MTARRESQAPGDAALGDDASADHARGEVHLGDLIRALADLPWRGHDQDRQRDQAHAAAIAACLGFGLSPRPSAATDSPRKVYDRRATRQQPNQTRQPASTTAPRVFVPPTPPRPLPLPEGTLSSRLSELPNRAPPQDSPPDWPAAGSAAFPPEPQPRLARATLLPERRARHILSAALSTTRPGGAIHLHRLIHALCRREPLTTLPRQLETTLDRGCDLLLDYSGSMVPFWEDLNDLTAQVGNLIGAQATRVYSFDTHPTQARHWTPTGDPRPWRPDGRPVLAATDLGIQGSAAVAAPRKPLPDPDWTEFARRCAQTGSPLILLIPWPQPRWPRSFATNATLVHWGPRTTAGMLRRQAEGR